MSDHDVVGKLTEMLTSENGSAFSFAAEHQPDDLDVLALPSCGGTARQWCAVTPGCLRRHASRCKRTRESDPSEFEVRIGFDRETQH